MVKGTEAITAKKSDRATNVKASVIGENNKEMPLNLPDMTVQSEGPERLMPPHWCLRQGRASEANMRRDEVTVDCIVQLLSQEEVMSQVRDTENDTEKWTVPVIMV